MPVTQVRMVQRGEQRGIQGGVVSETGTQSTCDVSTYGTERGTEWGGV